MDWAKCSQHWAEMQRHVVFRNQVKFRVETSQACEVGPIFTFNRIDPLWVQGTAVEQVGEIYQVEKVFQHIVVEVVMG